MVKKKWWKISGAFMVKFATFQLVMWEVSQATIDKIAPKTETEDNMV